MTPAQRHLQERQRRKPPRYALRSGQDRVQQLYETLRPQLPVELSELVASGAVAIGEVGDNVPDARTHSLGQGNFTIEFTSGMMDFQYAVARAFAGLDNSNKRLKVAPQTVGDVAVLVARVLRQSARYMRWHWLWPWRRIKWAEFPITRESREWVETMVTTGELFLLAHELGHVALLSGLVAPVSGNAEADADRYGMEFLLPTAEKYLHKRAAYAAAIIPIRVFGAMQRLGARFSDEYPPPADRIAALRRQIREMCPSVEYYYEVLTMMVAYQDMIDDIENKMDPMSPPALPDAERMMVRLLAELEGFAQGYVKRATFIENIGYLSKAIPRATLKEGARLLARNYLRLPPPPDTFLDVAQRVTMAAKLVELVDNLPSELRPIFPPDLKTCVS